MKLSENFTLKEATDSQAASRNKLNNTPNADTIQTMMKAAIQMEKVRALLGNKVISVSSWYRTPAVNKAVGSTALRSQHMTGEAIDFNCYGFGTPVEVCKMLVANYDIIRYDQLILEHSWVHISFSILNRKPRLEVLSLLESGDYAKGLTDKQGKLYN
jgi:zinc D-Ala-D-Ala carboxypeptidase